MRYGEMMRKHARRERGSPRRYDVHVTFCTATPDAPPPMRPRHGVTLCIKAMGSTMFSRAARESFHALRSRRHARHGAAMLPSRHVLPPSCGKMFHAATTKRMRRYCYVASGVAVCCLAVVILLMEREAQAAR